MKQSGTSIHNALRPAAVLGFALLVAAASVAQTTPPTVVGTIGYINGAPLTSHTSSGFKSTAASTLVAFVSTNTPWLGLLCECSCYEL